jgi:uncharacterized membrane protein YjgN (DUF898 family)
MAVDVTAAGSPTGGDPASSYQASFHGAGGDLFGIHIVNVFLTLLTLGFYRFWARVKVRKFLYGHTEFEGDRFAFHGTGRELFLRWIRGMLYLGVPLILLQSAELFSSSLPVVLLAKLLAALIVVIVLPLAIAAAWRYRLSRTEWRGIRFSFRERPVRAIPIWLGSLLLTALSFGLALPLVQVNMHRFLVTHSYFGTRRFGFDGRAGDLVGRYALFLVLAAPAYAGAFLLFERTGGLSVLAGVLLVVWLWFGYSAFKQRYLAGHTTFDTARFRSTVTGNGLLWLGTVNALLVVLTLGLGIPWAQVRSMRYSIDNLALEGPLDLAAIEQDARSASATGEALADILDVDVDMGAGF